MLVIASGTSLLLYWSRTPLELVGIYLGFGVGLAMIGPSLMAQVADIAPATHLGWAYGRYTTAIYTAMSLGPAVGGVLAQVWGYRPVFLVVAVALFCLSGTGPVHSPPARQIRDIIVQASWPVWCRKAGITTPCKAAGR